MASVRVTLLLVIYIAILETSVRSFLFQDAKCTVRPRVSVCAVCSGKGKNAPCRNADNFGFGQFCYLESVHNASGLFFTKGEATAAICQHKMNLSSQVQPECNKDIPALGTVCFDCCFQSSCSPLHHNCNNLDSIPVEIMPYQVHTTKPTSPTRTSTTRPTTLPTTTHSTTKSTTHHATKHSTHFSTKPTPQSTVTSSAARKGRSCQVCVEQSGITCTGSDYQTCDVSQPYCMNTLITDTTGSMVVKKCATEIECKFDYWMGTRIDTHCNTTSGFSAEVDLCHYCCQTDDGSPTPCNKEKVPTKLASFAPPPIPKVCLSKKCMVGDSLHGAQVMECDKGKEFCLNTVIFQTNSLYPVEQVSKKCALEAECKGQWWYNSHNRPECLTQNFQNETSPQFLCHYCCMSDEKGPCNGLDIPTHLYDFDNPTGGR